MGEHEGVEGPTPQSETGALPEGADVRPAAGAAHGVGVPPLRIKYARPDDLGPDSLDLLAAVDEPELLMQALRRLAAARPGTSWAIVGQHVNFAIQSLKVANEPPPRSADC